ncbi:MAG TPA: transporter [Pseudolabrys sp.]|nr:transporter [Pseudolabrys sp.]
MNEATLSRFALGTRHVIYASLLAASMIAPFARSGLADEGGVSFWVPGFVGSLAATPQAPGFAFANILYYSQVSAGGNVAFAKQVSSGNINVNFNGNFNANVHGSAQPLYLAIPGYTFATPVLGGQANVILGIPYGRLQSSADATIMGNLGLGGSGFTIGRSLTEAVTGIGDIVPQASLRWNFGVNNFMTYLTGNLTTGRYDPTRIANLGIGHNAIDAGGGYTYFDAKTGREFSATLGFTYNFANDHTQYQNGVDMHLDWGASQFLTKQWQIGIVGYWYNQLSCDSGAGDRVGCFKSRVAGIGPQIGYVIPISKDWQGYVNVKGYGEFAAQNRPDGWNVWLTFAISPAAPGERPPSSETGGR